MSEFPEKFAKITCEIEYAAQIPPFIYQHNEDVIINDDDDISNFFDVGIIFLNPIGLQKDDIDCLYIVSNNIPDQLNNKKWKYYVYDQTYFCVHSKYKIVGQILNPPDIILGNIYVVLKNGQIILLKFNVNFNNLFYFIQNQNAGNEN